MINLFEIKFVVFDFDDTLCIHTGHGSGSERAYNKSMLIAKNPWKGSMINSHMKEFMQLCEDRDIQMGLISATTSYPHMDRKHGWVFESYGFDLQNFCVGEADSKLDMLIAIHDAYNIERNRILIVDDRYATLNMCEDAGFMTATPMEVVNFIEAERGNI